MIYKQEALDNLEVFRRNTAHILGEGDPQVKTIDTCKMLVDEVEEQMEIIRCKDCKYYGRADKRRFYRGMDCLNKHIDTINPDKDLCSKAKRRV